MKNAKAHFIYDRSHTNQTVELVKIARLVDDLECPVGGAGGEGRDVLEVVFDDMFCLYWFFRVVGALGLLFLTWPRHSRVPIKF